MRTPRKHIGSTELKLFRANAHATVGLNTSIFASIAVSGGDSLYLVGKVLGHRQSRTTERYAHLKDDPLRAVANRTSERIAAIMQGGGGTQVVPLPIAKTRQ